MRCEGVYRVAALYLPRVDLTEEGSFHRRFRRVHCLRVRIVIHIRKSVINDPFFISANVPSTRDFTRPTINIRMLAHWLEWIVIVARFITAIY